MMTSRLRLWLSYSLKLKRNLLLWQTLIGMCIAAFTGSTIREKTSTTGDENALQDDDGRTSFRTPARDRPAVRRYVRPRGRQFYTRRGHQGKRQRDPARARASRPQA